MLTIRQGFDPVDPDKLPEVERRKLFKKDGVLKDDPKEKAEKAKKEEEFNRTKYIKPEYGEITEEQLKKRMDKLKDIKILSNPLYLLSDFHTSKQSTVMPKEIYDKYTRMMGNYRDPIRYINAMRDYHDIILYHASQYDETYKGRSFIDDLGDGLIRMNFIMPKYYPRKKEHKLTERQVCELLLNRKLDVGVMFRSIDKQVVIQDVGNRPWHEARKKLNHVESIQQSFQADKLPDYMVYGASNFMHYEFKKKKDKDFFSNREMFNRNPYQEAAETSENLEKELKKKLTIMRLKGAKLRDIVDYEDEVMDRVTYINMKNIEEYTYDRMLDYSTKYYKHHLKVSRDISAFTGSNYVTRLSMFKSNKSKSPEELDDNNVILYNRIAEVSNVIYERIKNFNAKFPNVLRELYKEQERQFGELTARRKDEDDDD